MNGIQQLNDECGQMNKKSPRTSILRRFEFKGRVVFDKFTLPPYTPRKALDRKSFPCHDACVYVFGWKTEMNGTANSPESLNSFKPKNSLSTITGSNLEQWSGKYPNPSSVIPVSESMIEYVRTIHLQNVIHEVNANRKKTQIFQELGTGKNEKHLLYIPTNAAGNRKSSKRRKVKQC